jgi:hypothetical protein
MSQIKEDHPDVAFCASFVMGLPNGLRSSEITALTKFSKDKTSRLLTFNRKNGTLKLYGAYWIEPRFYDSLKIAIDENSKLLRKMNDAKCRMVKQLKRKKEAEVSHKNKLHAPNSVWQLKDFL